MKKENKIILPLFALLVMALFPACSSEASDTSEQMNDTSQVPKGIAVGEYNPAIPGLSDLAEGFPEDFTIYPGSEVTASSVTPDKKFYATLMIVAEDREDTRDATYDDYKRILVDRGWELKSEEDVRETSQQRVAVFEKMDRTMTVSYWYMPSGNLSINVSIEPRS